MQQLVSVWRALDSRKRVIVAAAALAMFAAVLGLGKLASRPGMALLYAGLDEARSGEVLAALDQQGASYEVRGTAIYVETTRRDQLRMSLASEGLPASTEAGYEILDSLSGFGTTSQMFDAAYLRAKEGELARTISAQPSIRAARVHIADTRAQGLRAEARPTASVVVTSTTGGLNPAQAKALKYLVASAVSGMRPDDVAVIDDRGGLVESGSDQPGMVPDDRAETLRRNVERLLEARVGYGNAVVEVSVDTVTEREAITERRIDPDGRVAISTDTEERSANSSDAGGQGVSVASNLPAGNAAGATTTQSRNSETRERTNFEVSETTREVLRTPGALRRLTVAVLVDGISTTSDTGEPIKTPRPDEELAALHDLVAAAVGFDAARGDVITIKSMGFETLAASEPVAASLWALPEAFDLVGLIKFAAFSLVALVLGLFVLRPILSGRGTVAAPRASLAPPQGVALTGEIADEGSGQGDGARLPAARGAAGQSDADPMNRLRRLIAERQDDTVDILRGWMEEAEEGRT
ncbi:flagellar basal-body MS-ring/collar protein FliF [Albidovulum sp.]|uniref:flagellar basal-body MS-ring/collar protein FliF n=1 Tax=Albidovulum sp. TaxID=1872424 RepID=UPI0035298C0E